jgi:hypothetical protein
VLGRIGELGAALAERRLRPEHVAHLPDLLADLGPLLGLGAEQPLTPFNSAAKILVLGADLEFLELAQGLRSRMLRMASAWISVSLNAFISTGFGSSSARMILITLSMLR